MTTFHLEPKNISTVTLNGRLYPGATGMPYFEQRDNSKSNLDRKAIFLGANGFVKGRLIPGHYGTILATPKFTPVYSRSLIDSSRLLKTLDFTIEEEKLKYKIRQLQVENSTNTFLLLPNIPGHFWVIEADNCDAFCLFLVELSNSISKKH